MQRHLDAGCPPCAETLRSWSAVAAVAVQDAAYQPPEGVLRQVLAQFALHRPAGLLERVGRQATLLFDSFRQPVPVGVRASGSSPRQTLYKAGPYLIMLRVDPGVGADAVSVVGQILYEADSRKAVQDVAVYVLSGKMTVDRTLTNQLGEFELKLDLAEDLCLSIPEMGPLTLPLLASRKSKEGKGERPLEGPGRQTKARQH